MWELLLLRSIPGNYLARLVQTMPQVYKAVLKVKGGYSEASAVQNLFCFVYTFLLIT